MSGGASEYVMGNMASSYANFLTHTMFNRNSGTNFGMYSNITLPKRYYNIYDYGTTIDGAAAYQRGKLGDATREVVSSNGNIWTNASAIFPSETFPWFSRGGTFSSGSIWIFDRHNGIEVNFYSSRAVLVYIPS